MNIKKFGFLAVASFVTLAGASIPALGMKSNEVKNQDIECCSVAASTSVSPCINVIEVSLGEQIPLQVFHDSTPDSSVTLTAGFGQISSSGIYTAPSTLPPLGLDYIEIVDSFGVPISRTWLQTIPAEGYLPSAPGPIPPGLTNMQMQTVAAQASGATLRSEVQPLSELQPIALQNIGGVIGSPAPLRPSDEENPDLTEEYTLLLLSGAHQKGKKCALFPPPVGPCQNGGTTKVEGPEKIHHRGTITTVSASYTVGPVAGTIIYKSEDCILVQFKDVYKCINNVWVYQYTEQCNRNGEFGYNFTPDVVIIPGGPSSAGMILGFDLGGYKWAAGNPICRRL